MLTELERKIKVIKHFVDRAEGFTFCNEGDDICPEYMLKHHHWEFWPSGSDFVTTGMWSLFLQIAIEGVNRAKGPYRIEQMYNMVEVVESEEYEVKQTFSHSFRYENEAKLKALEWVMEKEKES